MLKPLSEYTRDEIEIALRNSVKLQSHYADLLNMYAGGNRLEFPSAEHWMDRLDVIGDLKTLLDSETPT